MNRGRSLIAICLTALAFSPPVFAETVHGSVVGPNKEPIAGATVIIISPLNREPVTVKSGADGAWSGDLPDKPDSPNAANVPADFKSFRAAMLIAPGHGFGAKMGKSGDVFNFSLGEPTDIGGTVTDQNGTPLAGVSLQIKGIYTHEFNPPGLTQENKIPFDILQNGIEGDGMDVSTVALLSTKTDVQGKWHFDGVPKGMRVFMTLADDRFSIPDVDVTAGTLDAVITASPGATVKGRVLLPDGTPAVGVRLAVADQAGIKTDAEGRFIANRIAPGDIWITAVDEKKNWMPAGQNITGLHAGETRDIGDITLAKGIDVTGKVVDQTGKGIANATIYCNGDGGASDANGNFKIRVGAQSSWVSVSKEGYLPEVGGGSQTQTQLQINPDEKEHVMEPVKLVRGVYVSGTIHDEAGKPVEGVVLNAGQNYENSATGTVAKDGTFRFGPLKPGAETTLHVGDAWDLTTEVKFKAPLYAEEATAPKLNLTVKKIELLPVKGRVVSPEGVPVPGVAVHFRIYFNEKHDSYTNGDITSDDKGVITFGALRPEQSPGFDSLASDRFSFVKTGTPVKEDKQWNLGDIVVSPLDGVISGQVVDAAGAPVPEAKIVVAGRNLGKTFAADAQGNFSLDKLPRGEVNLLVAKDHSFANVTIKTGPGAKIVLENRPVPTAEDGQKMLLAEPNGQANAAISGMVPPLDADFALSLIQKDGAGVPNPGQVAQLIAGIARKDPAKAAAWGIPQWQKLPAGNQDIQDGTALALAVIPFNRDFSTAWLKEAHAKITKTDFSEDAAKNYIALAGLAGALGDKEADDLLDLGLTAADRSVIGDKRSEVADNWGRSVGRTPELVDRLVEEMEPMHQMKALAGAVQTLAPINATAAQSLLARLVTLHQDPAVKKEDAKIEAARQNSGLWHDTSGEILSHAQTALANTLAANPGKAALDMAMQVSDDYRRQTALIDVAQHYLDAGHQLQASAALHALEDQTSQWDDNAASGPAIALLFDKKLAKEMLDKQRDRIFSVGYETSEYRPSGAAYALNLSAFDAGEARLIVENEWAWRVASIANKPVNESESAQWQMRPLVQVMGTMDLPRALEMLGQLKDRYGQNGDLKWEVGLYLMTNGKTNLFSVGENDDF